MQNRFSVAWMSQQKLDHTCLACLGETVLFFFVGLAERILALKLLLSSYHGILFLCARSCFAVWYENKISDITELPIYEKSTSKIIR